MLNCHDWHMCEPTLVHVNVLINQPANINFLDSCHDVRLAASFTAAGVFWVLLANSQDVNTSAASHLNRYVVSFQVEKIKPKPHEAFACQSWDVFSWRTW